MSIAGTYAPLLYACNGIVNTFPIPGTFFASSDVQIYTITPGTPFPAIAAATGISIAGGVVTFATPPVSGVIVYVGLAIPETQPASYVAQDNFPAAAQEAALDRVTMLVQQLDQRLQRVFRMPTIDAPQVELTPAMRASMVTGYDSSGNPVLYPLSAALFATGASAQVVNIAALKLLSITGLTTGYQVPVAGFSTYNDGGGGTFIWNSTSTTTDDGGTVIQATGVATGRWFRQYSGALNVRWFGAKGDGTTDDGAAIRLALAALGVHPGRVYIPTGNYLVTGGSTVFNLTAGQVVQGDSSGVTSFQLGSNITYLGAAVLFALGNQAGLRDICLTGNSSAPVSGSQGIRLATTPGSALVENVCVIYFDKNIYAINTTLCTLVNVLSIGGTYNLYCDTGTTSLTIIGGQLSSGVNGMLVADTANNITLLGTTIKNNTTTGVVISGTATQANISFRGCFFGSNTLITAGADILLNNTGTGNLLYGVVIDGCQFASAFNGVDVEGAVGAVIRGCLFSGAAVSSKTIIFGAAARKCEVGVNAYVAGVHIYNPATDDAGVSNSYTGGLSFAWTATLNSFTLVGTPTLTGSFTMSGLMVHLTLKIVPATTVAGVAGTANITGLPIAAATAGGHCAVDDMTSHGALGGGPILTSTLYPPTIPSSGDTLLVTASYLKT